MMVSSDKYTLPLVVADSIKELSDRTGVNRYTIASALCHTRKGDRHSSRYIEVEIDDE